MIKKDYMYRQCMNDPQNFSSKTMVDKPDKKAASDFNAFILGGEN